MHRCIAPTCEPEERRLCSQNGNILIQVANRGLGRGVRMRLVGLQQLHTFGATNPDARPALEAWILEVRQATWRTPHDVRHSYPRARLIGGNRILFNIRHNRFRLDVGVDYKNGVVVVMRVGTHKDYDSWTFP